MTARGYRIEALLEQEATGRLATVRLAVPGEGPGGIIVDLLFASSGVEPEIVAAAQSVDVFPQVSVPVATLGHLLAVKALAGRPKDLIDLESLKLEADSQAVEDSKELVRLIVERGFQRNKDLPSMLELLVPPQTFSFKDVIMSMPVDGDDHDDFARPRESGCEIDPLDHSE